MIPLPRGCHPHYHFDDLTVYYSPSRLHPSPSFRFTLDQPDDSMAPKAAAPKKEKVVKPKVGAHVHCSVLRSGGAPARDCC